MHCCKFINLVEALEPSPTVATNEGPDKVSKIRHRTFRQNAGVPVSGRLTQRVWVEEFGAQAT